MAVKIRMKMMGRRHRPYFRICAMDTRTPRDGRVIEELGTYDPLVPDVDARALVNHERVSYWLKVGAQPSEKVKVLLKKYGPNGTRLKEQEAARARLALPKVVPHPGEPAYVPPPKSESQASAAEAAPAETPAESAAEGEAPAAE